MNQQDLERIQRAFAKAQGGDGPQAIADWATQNAPALFAKAAEAIDNGGGLIHPDFDDLAAHYPGVEADAVIAAAAGDIKAMRAERSKWANPNKGATMTFEPADFVVRSVLTEAVDALRPFAQLGAPVTLRTAERLAAENWDGETLVAIADETGALVARVTIEEAQQAAAIVQKHPAP